MAIFGLSTRKEVEKLIDDALKASADKYPLWALRTAETERLTLGDPSAFEQPEALYRKVSWILQAVDNTASAGALARFDVKRVISDKEPKDIPNHAFEMLLRNPNPLDSRYQFLYGTIAMYKLTGNSYWWLNRPDELTAPDEMWLIPSHMIVPIPDENMYIRGYYYYPGNGNEFFLPPHEIIQFRRYNPFSRFLGLSAMEAIALIAMSDLEMLSWTKRLFGENNGRLPSILTFEEMVADPTWAKIKNDTREASKNRSMLMLRGVGAGGIQWLQNAMTQKDMEFIESRKATGKEIMDTLAPGLYTWLSGESTYSNAGANRAAFNELTLYPMHVMMAEEITNKILPAYGSDKSRPLIGEFEDVRIADKEQELKEQEEYSKTHTIDEIRQEKYGDDPIGDKRGELLIVQVKAESGGIQDPPPPPVMKQPGPPAGDPPADTPPEGKDIQPDAPTRAQKAVLELNTWQRKAVKRVGKATPFETAIIPENIAAYVNQFLPDCDSMSAVKSVFDNARRMVDPESAPKVEAPKQDGLMILAKSLDAITAKLTQTEPLTIEAVKALLAENRQTVYPSTTIHLPETQQSLHFTVPQTEAPQANIYLSPTVEAAKAPDVRIDSPVTIHQAAAEPSITNLNIENKVPEQGAPIVNVGIENKIPEQAAPTVKNEIVMPEPSAPVVNVNVQPTPIQNTNEITVQPADVNIDIPKPKRQKQNIQRGKDGSIESTDTEIEY